MVVLVLLKLSATATAFASIFSASPITAFDYASTAVTVPVVANLKATVIAAFAVASAYFFCFAVAAASATAVVDGSPFVIAKPEIKTSQG